MPQNITAGVDAWLAIYLTKDNAPVTGLVFSDVTCLYLRTVDAVFAGKTLDADSFREKSDGLYEVLFSGDEPDEVAVAGPFRFKVKGATIDECEAVYEVVAAPDAGAGVTLPTCVVSGDAVDETGAPIAGVAIYWQPAPAGVVNAAAVRRRTRTVYSRSDGTWSFEAPRLLTISVDIPDCDIARILTVPNQASARFEKIP